MQDEHGFLRKCDTGELSCVVCIGRENCKEYVNNVPDLKTCIKCGRAFLSDESKPLIQQTPDDFNIPCLEDNLCPSCKENLKDAPLQIESMSVKEFSIYSQSCCKKLKLSETDRAAFYELISARINRELDKEANRFPFRSGYNLSVGFVRYKTTVTNILTDLHKKDDKLEEILEIIYNFFKNLPEDKSYVTETDDEIIFMQYGMRMAYYEDFLQQLGAV